MTTRWYHERWYHKSFCFSLLKHEITNISTLSFRIRSRLFYMKCIRLLAIQNFGSTKSLVLFTTSTSTRRYYENMPSNLYLAKFISITETFMQRSIFNNFQSKAWQKIGYSVISSIRMIDFEWIRKDSIQNLCEFREAIMNSGLIYRFLGFHINHRAIWKQELYLFCLEIT